MAQPISNLAIGSKVKFGALHGAPIVWRVADKNHSGYPDNSITLVSDQLIKLMPYDAKEPQGVGYRGQKGNNRYIHSNIRQWMNSNAGAGEWYEPQHPADMPPASGYVSDNCNAYDAIAGFLNGFNADEQNALLNTTITVARSDADGGGTETCDDKMFLLSSTELNIGGNPVCGSALKHFVGNSIVATMTALCAANSNYPYTPAAGAAWYYWLRDAYNGSDYDVYIITDGGGRQHTGAFYCYYGIRPACNLSLDLKVEDATDSDGCYTIIYNQDPTMPVSITVPDQVYGGSSTEVSWGSATDVDGNLSGYILEQSVDAGDWAQVYKGTTRSYSVPITFGWNTVQFRVKAYDADGAESAYNISATRTVINNRPPVISGNDADLGNFVGTPPGHTYSITDEDGDQVTVVEAIDGVEHRSYACTLGASNTFSMTADQWLETLNGSHTLTITATDARGAISTRTLTFTKVVNVIEFEQTIAMAADDMPTKALVNVQGNFPAGCELQVWICNNGNDAAPAWQEVTPYALNGQKIFFTNTTKTASAWGVKVKAKLLRGTVTETCYIHSIGGNFA